VKVLVVTVNELDPKGEQMPMASPKRNPLERKATFDCQGDLPRLPIPSLEETLQKFENVTMKALLTPTELEEMKKDVKEFLEGDGPSLQEALLKYEADNVREGKIGSYVEEFWNDAYLAPDSSVVLNLNPYFLLEDGPDPKIAKDQLRRAASLTFAAVRVASALRNHNIAPDTFKGKPLCMDQFKALFGASRQPALDSSDRVHVYEDSSHVLVLCNCQFYFVPVLWPDSGNVAVDETDIHRALEAVEKDAYKVQASEANKKSIGVFTSLPRSEWAELRSNLVATKINAESLNVIDSALFVLVLDNYSPTSIHDAAANVLHGTSQLKPGDTAQVGTCLNRWYDKLQLIVSKDGSCGINFEHSAIDGHTALRFVSDVFAETVISFAESIVDVIHGRGRIQHVVEAMVDRASQSDRKDAPDTSLKKLQLDLDDHMIERIHFAETALCDELGASDTFVLEFKNFGKRFIVENSMSPDSFVQMSMLLAYYKLYGKVVTMYEPVLTKSFYHGRTEAQRSTTTQASQLCKVWCRKDSSKADKIVALRSAVKEHSQLVRESAAGKGVDRHLFSLRCIAERNSKAIPRFFSSTSWKKLNHTVLSTSNCGNPALRLFGFGPVVPDGFGIGYIIKDYALSYSVSSRHRQTQRYVRSLQNVLNEMEQVVSSTDASVTEATPEASTSFEYPDIWGENSALPASQPLSSLTDTNNQASQRLRSMSFSTVVSRESSLSLLQSLSEQVVLDVNDE